MTIQQLALRAGVTTRTIRYYVEQGLLPPPGRGRPAEYTEEHLQRLALIAALKRQYLPLEEIRDTMQKLTLQEVQALLAPKGRAEHRPTGSAADYIRSLMERTADREEMKRQSSQGQRQPQAPPGPQSPPAPLPEWSPPAPAREPPNIPAPTPYRETRAAPSLPLPLVAAPWDNTAAGPDGEGDIWHRVTLAEGIEVHYRPSTRARNRQLVDRLLEAARKALESSPGTQSEE